MISVGPKSATVSCAVGYLAKNFLDYPVYISVPTFLAKSTNTDLANLRNVLRPRLETEGRFLSRSGFQPVDPHTRKLRRNAGF